MSTKKTNIKTLSAEKESLFECGIIDKPIEYFKKELGFLDDERVTRLLNLISNPYRLKILFLLLEQDAFCNCNFQEILGIQQTLISHYLRELRENDLITFEKIGKWHYYSLTEEFRPFVFRLKKFLFTIPK